jgi:probable RNA-binding protein EIF1AD
VGEGITIVQDTLTRRRPKEFVKKSTYVPDSDEEESTVGKMPPADSDED